VGKNSCVDAELDWKISLENILPEDKSLFFKVNQLQKRLRSHEGLLLKPLFMFNVLWIGTIHYADRILSCYLQKIFDEFKKMRGPRDWRFEGLKAKKIRGPEIFK